MIDLAIPGFGNLLLTHLVLDYNGTLARDGVPLDGVADRLARLKNELQVVVVTADTFGSVRRHITDPDIQLRILGNDCDQTVEKRRVIDGIGGVHVAAIGNGRNDRMMLERAAVGIAVVQTEGASPEILSVADVVMNSILDALDLFVHAGRLKATLRS